MARAQVYLQQEHFVGDTCVLESLSPSTEYAVVFEDDGSTGHFHGLNISGENTKLCDLLHIYDVDSVDDKHLPVSIQIVWSDDGYKAALLLNGAGHGVFDFSAQRAYCRNNRPKSNRFWTKFDHKWSDDVEALFE